MFSFEKLDDNNIHTNSSQAVALASVREFLQGELLLIEGADHACSFKTILCVRSKRWST
jgi:hypothetical protein